MARVLKHGPFQAYADGFTNKLGYLYALKKVFILDFCAWNCKMRICLFVKLQDVDFLCMKFQNLVFSVPQNSDMSILSTVFVCLITKCGLETYCGPIFESEILKCGQLLCRKFQNIWSFVFVEQVLD